MLVFDLVQDDIKVTVTLTHMAISVWCGTCRCYYSILLLQEKLWNLIIEVNKFIHSYSLNESLLILCSSLTKSRVEECDKSGQNSSCKYCESSMYIVYVCLAPALGGALWIVGAGLPSSCWEPCGWSSHACQGSEYQKAKNIFKNIH